MVRVFLLAAALLAAAPPSLSVVDENGNPVSGSTVVPVGNNRVRVSAPGYEARIVVVTSRVHTVALQRSLPVIASVRVATGSTQTLHSLPVAASALDQASIAASSAFTSDAVLRQLPGFDRARSNSMFSNYGLLRVSFAGAGNDRGLVLVDGIPAQDGFGGQVDWAAYPPAQLQRAELLLGAGSALYGAGAAGGVLDLQTIAPPSSADSVPAGDVTFAAGTHQYARISSSLSAPIAPKVTAVVAAAQQRLQYWDLPPAYQSSIDRIAQSSASTMSARLRYRAGDRDAIEAGERAAWDDQFEGRTNYTFSRRLAQFDARYTHSTLQGFVQTALFSRTAFIENVADKFPLSPGVLRYVQQVPTNEDGISSSWIVGSLHSTFELRTDARNVRGQSTQVGAGNVFQNSGSGSQNISGIAAQQTWRARRYQIVAGARFDTVRSYNEQLVSTSRAGAGRTVNAPPPRSDAALSPRLALRYDLSPRLAVRASSGAGFRPPFLNELVRGFFIAGVEYRPNPSLVPERSRTNSAGFDYADAQNRVGLDVFDTIVHDAIMFRTIDPTTQQRTNIGRTRTDGYTLNYTHALGLCSRLSASFTSEYARVTSGPSTTVGNRLQYVPSHSGSIAYTGHAGNVKIGTSLTYLGQTYADDLNVQPLGTSLVAGASIRIPIGADAQVEVAADNITGARYLSSIDRYGIPSTLSIGVSLPLAGGNDQQRSTRCTP
jgi:outer membrane receptor protein involved in Fe transport